jgi:voltage-gated potassium channel
LLKAGIKRARHLIAVLGDDPLNVYLVLSARILNPTINIVSRADDPSVEKKLYQAGANRVLSPYLSGAKKMALAVLKPNVMDFIDIAGYDPTTSLQLEEILVEERVSLSEQNHLRNQN